MCLCSEWSPLFRSESLLHYPNEYVYSEKAVNYWLHILLVLYVAFQAGCASVNTFGGLLVLRFITAFLGSPALATGGASMVDLYAPQYVCFAFIFRVGLLNKPLFRFRMRLLHGPMPLLSARRWDQQFLLLRSVASIGDGQCGLYYGGLAWSPYSWSFSCLKRLTQKFY